MSRRIGVEGVTTLKMAPVLEVRETAVMGTLKLIKDTPDGGASVTVRVKFAVPGGGVVVPPGAPLQELSRNTARTSRMERLREKRFMWHPMPEDKYFDAERRCIRSPIVTELTNTTLTSEGRHATRKRKNSLKF